jgi:hypothetical protein
MQGLQLPDLGSPGISAGWWQSVSFHAPGSTPQPQPRAGGQQRIHMGNGANSALCIEPAQHPSHAKPIGWCGGREGAPPGGPGLGSWAPVGPRRATDAASARRAARMVTRRAGGSVADVAAVTAGLYLRPTKFSTLAISLYEY